MEQSECKISTIFLQQPTMVDPVKTREALWVGENARENVKGRRNEKAKVGMGWEKSKTKIIF